MKNPIDKILKVLGWKKSSVEPIQPKIELESFLGLKFGSNLNALEEISNGIIYSSLPEALPLSKGMIRIIKHPDTNHIIAKILGNWSQDKVTETRCIYTPSEKLVSIELKIIHRATKRDRDVLLEEIAGRIAIVCNLQDRNFSKHVSYYPSTSRKCRIWFSKGLSTIEIIDCDPESHSDGGDYNILVKVWSEPVLLP